MFSAKAVRPRAAKLREMLEALARLLAEDESLIDELRLAKLEPERYCARYAERLELRGIRAPRPELELIALLDGLIERQACVELDWREEPEGLVAAITQLRRRYPAIDWSPPQLQGVSLEQALERFGPPALSRFFSTPLPSS